MSYLAICTIALQHVLTLSSCLTEILLIASHRLSRISRQCAPPICVLLRAAPLPLAPSQHFPRPLLKRLDHQPRHLRRRRLTQGRIHRARKLHLDMQAHLRPSLRTGLLRIPFLRRAIRRLRLEREFAERPACEEGSEEITSCRLGFGRMVGPVVVVWQGGRGYCWFGFTGYGFEGTVGKAVDAAGEGLAVGSVADVKVSCSWPLSFLC